MFTTVLMNFLCMMFIAKEGLTQTQGNQLYFIFGIVLIWGMHLCLSSDDYTLESMKDRRIWFMFVCFFSCILSFIICFPG